ncbi:MULTISPECIES: hypothetical protein [Streptacidiphilus]|uniref:Uncharacterized protein n=2 Tax=Streptacidiphilus TaxID=228398 RepID=A0ABV6UF47_9ACTN|nr:hypothetical protein [Streptacidiphilus jeojiense]
MSQQKSRQDQDQERLAAVLRTEAERHRPDREAMLARVERGQFSGAVRGRRRRTSGRAGLRLAGIVLASAVGFGLSVAGTWAAVGEFSAPKPTEPVVAVTTPSSVGSAEATPSPSPSSAPASPSAGASSPSTATGTAGATGATRVQQGFLWSDGSIDPHSNTSWSQSNITLKNRYTVTALDVTVTLADTPGLSSTGAWSTVPAADLDTTVTSRNGTLVYEFKLKPGATLAPGSYVFAGQYNHAAGGRDAGQDTYRATATGHGSGAEVYGNFAATH